MIATEWISVNGLVVLENGDLTLTTLFWDDQDAFVHGLDSFAQKPLERASCGSELGVPEEGVQTLSMSTNVPGEELQKNLFVAKIFGLELAGPVGFAGYWTRDPDAGSHPPLDVPLEFLQKVVTAWASWGNDA